MDGKMCPVCRAPAKYAKNIMCADMMERLYPEECKAYKRKSSLAGWLEDKRPAFPDVVVKHHDLTESEALAILRSLDSLDLWTCDSVETCKRIRNEWDALYQPKHMYWYFVCGILRHKKESLLLCTICRVLVLRCGGLIVI